MHNHIYHTLLHFIGVNMATGRYLALGLKVNCGFARVALYNISRELTKDTPKSKARTSINKAERVSLFKAQFEVCSDYGLSEEYFSRVGDRESQFDRDASRILTAFGKKWHPAGAREEYKYTFSKSKREQLLKYLKVKHSLQ